MGALPQHRTPLDSEGYLLLGPLLSDRAADLARWCSALASMPERAEPWMYFETVAGERLLHRLEKFHAHEGFRHILDGALRRAVGDHLCEPLLFKEKINLKPPGAAADAPHQDAQAGWQRYASLHVTAMVAIDACTRENGCLEIASHRGERRLLGPQLEPLPASFEADWRPLELLPGDVVLFDGYAPHRSGRNGSRGPRRILYATYNAAAEGDQRARYLADKWQTYPPDCARLPGRDYVYRV